MAAVGERVEKRRIDFRFDPPRMLVSPRGVGEIRGLLGGQFGLWRCHGYALTRRQAAERTHEQFRDGLRHHDHWLAVGDRDRHRLIPSEGGAFKDWTNADERLTRWFDVSILGVEIGEHCSHAIVPLIIEIGRRGPTRLGAGAWRRTPGRATRPAQAERESPGASLYLLATLAALLVVPWTVRRES